MIMLPLNYYNCGLISGNSINRCDESNYFKAIKKSRVPQISTIFRSIELSEKIFFLIIFILIAFFIAYFYCSPR